MSCWWRQEETVIGDLPVRAVSITPVRCWYESPGRVFVQRVLLTATLSTFTSQNTFRPSGWGQQRFPASLWLNCISIHWGWSFDPCGSLIEFLWRSVRWPPGCGCFPRASACSSASSRGEVMALSPGTQRLKWFLQHVVAFRRIVKLTQQHISHDVVACQSAVGNTTQEVISTTCLTQD